MCILGIKVLSEPHSILTLLSLYNRKGINVVFLYPKISPTVFRKFFPHERKSSLNLVDLFTYIYFLSCVLCSDKQLVFFSYLLHKEGDCLAPETTIRPPYQLTYIVSLIQYRYKTCTANGGGRYMRKETC